MRAAEGRRRRPGRSRWFLSWTHPCPPRVSGPSRVAASTRSSVSFPTAPVFALAIAGLVVAVAERRWRLLLLTAGPFAGHLVLPRAPSPSEASPRAACPTGTGASVPPARFLMAGLPLLTVLAALTLDRLRGRLGWSHHRGALRSTFAYTAVHVDLAGLAVPGRHWPGHGSAHRLSTDRPRSGPASCRPSSRRTPGGRGRDWPCSSGSCSPDTYCRAGQDRTPHPGPGSRGPWQPSSESPSWSRLRGSTRPAPTRRSWRPGGVGSASGASSRSVAEARPPLENAWSGRHSGMGCWRWLRACARVATGIVVRAGAQAVDSGPALLIEAGAAPPQHVVLESAVPPVWREREYAVEIQWSGGRLPIRLELGQVSRQDPVRLAYVDTIEIRRLPP